MTRSLHVLTPGSAWSAEQLRGSAMASVRLRAAIAADAVAERGWIVSAGDRLPEHATDVLIGKIGSGNIEQRAPIWLEQIQRARKSGVRLWLDYTDHHLGFESPMSGFYQDVLPWVTTAVVPSSAMRSLLGSVWQGATGLVVDALDVPVIAPKQGVAGARQTALWFGHASNMRYLLQFLWDHAWLAEHIKVLVLSNSPGLDLLRAGYRGAGACIGVQALPWSPAAVIEAAETADLALIPSDPADPRKAGVSSNRLITALALGLPVAADVLPAYAAYRPYFADLRSAALGAWLHAYDERRHSVLRAQALVVPHYAKATVAASWLAMFNGLKEEQEYCVNGRS